MFEDFLHKKDTVLGTEVPKAGRMGVDGVQRVDVLNVFGKAGVRDNPEEQLGLGVVLKGLNPMPIVRQLGTNCAIQEG